MIDTKAWADGREGWEVWNKSNMEIEVLEMEDFQTRGTTFGGDGIPDMH